ncbi:LIC13255 family lipoprotein [Leptospira sp. 'Mane']|uniref:LIC13255 family lipoprotein n=1 Tax=Leptospira sp. 'Mane' TaxID=3387407 RepID=UPI00398A6036
MPLKILLLILSFAFASIHCISNKDDIFYSGAEANYKIFEAFAVKDSACGQNHKITSFVFGKVKQSDVDACTKAINLMSCSSWAIGDPAPFRCKSINYKL